jgi:hypothetical protein
LNNSRLGAQIAVSLSKLGGNGEGYWSTELYKTTSEFHLGNDPLAVKGASNLPKPKSNDKRWNLAEEQKKKQYTSVRVGSDSTTNTLHQHLGKSAFDQSIFHRAQDGNAEQQMAKLRDKLFVIFIH